MFNKKLRVLSNFAISLGYQKSNKIFDFGKKKFKMKHLKRIHTLPMKLYFSYLEVMQPTPKLLTNFSKLFIQILISKQHFEFNQTLVVEGNAPAVRKYLLLPSFVNFGRQQTIKVLRSAFFLNKFCNEVEVLIIFYFEALLDEMETDQFVRPESCRLVG